MILGIFYYLPSEKNVLAHNLLLVKISAPSLMLTYWVGEGYNNKKYGGKAMKKVLVAYVSRTGKTEKIAESIAEGIRISGNEAELRKISDIKSHEELAGYDGYVFGCPTYHRDMTAGMKTFLFLAEKANLLGKMGGAFGSYKRGDAGRKINCQCTGFYTDDMPCQDKLGSTCPVCCITS